MLFYRSIAATLRLAFVAAGILFNLGANCHASTWVNVLNTTINIDRVQYVTPLVCVKYRDGSAPNVVMGSCAFSVVFDGKSFTIERAQSSDFLADGARDQLTFSLSFGPDEKVKTYEDAEKTLRPFRDLLPK